MSTLGASGSIKTAAAAGNAEFPAPFLAHPFSPLPISPAYSSFSWPN